MTNTAPTPSKDLLVSRGYEIRVQQYAGECFACGEHLPAGKGRLTRRAAPAGSGPSQRGQWIVVHRTMSCTRKMFADLRGGAWDSAEGSSDE